MGKSFVLKRPGGALAGYLMTNRTSLQLRVSGIPVAGGELTLMDGQGTLSRRHMKSTEQEQTLEGTGGEITSAYAIGGGRVIFATDAQAMQAAERILAERMRMAAEEDGRRKAPPVRQDARDRTDSAGQPGAEHPAQDSGPGGEQRDADARKAEGRRLCEGLMQRRWPPPPCLTGVRYVGGRWVTATESRSDTPGAPPRCDAT